MTNKKIKKEEKQIKNPQIKCNHAIAIHEGHSLLYARTTKYQKTLTREEENDGCCGGVSLFNYCPFCGKYVRDIVEKLLIPNDQ